ncbi:MAG: LysE family transporter [Candidatus Methanomethyliaceae archaeon]|nr:LysE family transporter [Candidatus Methanomethyliaceae archaeon]
MQVGAEIFGVFLAGIALGLSIAAPPGPVNAMIAIQSTRSTLRGFLVGLGAMTSDATFLIITYNLRQFLEIQGLVKGALSLVSSVLLAYLAYLTLRSVKKLGGPGDSGRRTSAIPYITGLSIGLTNPFQIAWWMSVGLSLISSIGLIIIIGFFSGILLWIVSFPMVIHFAQSRVPQLYKIVGYASAALLIAFSLWFMFSALQLLI